MKKIFLIAIALFALASQAFSDEIKGRVLGEEPDKTLKPLVKATITEFGTSNGVYSDADGYFSIKVSPKSHYIVVSYVGYERDTVHFHDNDNLEIILKSSLTTGSVTVTGDKQAVGISMSSTINAETISSKGLHKAACCNLAESFEVSPSVDVEYSDAVSGAKRIQLLGLAGVYSQLLIEKIPSMRGLGGIYGLTHVPGPWMESIQVSKGSASVTTGFESMTGQINVEYKKPENFEPTFINMYGDMLGRGEMSVYHTVKLSDRLSTMFMGHGNYYNNSIDDNGDSFLDKPKISQINLQNRWKYQGDIYESVTGVRALVEDRKGGQKGFFPDKDPTLYGIDVKTQRYEAFTKNGFIFNDEPFSSLGTIVSFTHHKQESFYGKRNYDAEQNSFYTNLLYQFEPFEEHGVTTGVSYQYDNYLEEFDKAKDNRFESIPGVFAEYTFQGIHDLTVLAGIRADFPNAYKTFITPRFHFRYALDELTTIRGSIGKGYRIPHIYAEHTGLLASARKFELVEKLNPEEALNYGLNASTIVNLFGIDFTFNAEYYRTDFQNQVIVDMDADPSKVSFYNLKGKSFSNSFQFDMQFEPIARLVLTTAYRLNDVKMTINGNLEDKPLQSRHKGFFNAMYDTRTSGWNFDLTLEYNGGGRLPNTEANPEGLRLKKEFPDFVVMNAQITKKFKNWDIYIGGENLTGFIQKNPILDAESPFSNYFDSSMIWGPIFGRMFYAGIRVNFD